jgi:RimJ/RimL family protein N-acetyltransferase
VFTSRLEVRPPVEADRRRFVELMCDDEFMVLFDGARTAGQAHQWFDHMLAVCDEVPFGKQPVIERASGLIVGYVGVDWFDLDHERLLEIGWCPGTAGWDTPRRPARPCSARRRTRFPAISSPSSIAATAPPSTSRAN